MMVTTTSRRAEDGGDDRTREETQKGRRNGRKETVEMGKGAVERKRRNNWKICHLVLKIEGAGKKNLGEKIGAGKNWWKNRLVKKLIL